MPKEGNKAKRPKVLYEQEELKLPKTCVGAILYYKNNRMDIIHTDEYTSKLFKEYPPIATIYLRTDKDKYADLLEAFSSVKI